MSDEMDEIWTLYADDGKQALDAMEEALDALKNGEGEASEHVSALFRAVHTFKGNSRVLGLATVESRAHLSEDLIGLVRDNGVPLTSEILDMLFLASDTLVGMLEETVETRSDVSPEPSESLAEGLQALIARVMPAEIDEGDDAPMASDEVEDPQSFDDLEVEVKAENTCDGEDVAAAEEPAVLDDPFEDKEAATATTSPEADNPDNHLDALAVDPVYLRIFTEMAETALTEIDAILASNAEDRHARMKSALSGLAYAAGQLNLSDWIEALDCGEIDDDETMQAVRTRIAHQLGATQVPETAAEDVDEVKEFFIAFGPILVELSEAGANIRNDNGWSAEARRAFAEHVEALAAPLGLVRLIEAGRTLSEAETCEDYEICEFAFYEELAAYERLATPEGLPPGTPIPSAMLRAFCSDFIFDTLQAIRTGIESGKREAKSDWFPKFEVLMRRTYHASCHYHMETAGQLAMALIDLFARARMDEVAPDPILLQMARGFVETMELVFDAVSQGDQPDTDSIERLFEEAASVCFLQSDQVTAKSIEKKLSIPDPFLRVLSPESVKAVHSAITAGLGFFVLRADLNDDEHVAEHFLQWITSDAVRMITNVTVFEGDRTLFDFLIATKLADDAIVSALAKADPSGRSLSLIERLEVADEFAGRGEPQSEETFADPAKSSMDLAADIEILEAIGEISAGQALVGHLLNHLGDMDILQEAEAALRNRGLPPIDRDTRSILREIVDRQSIALQEVTEAGTQIASQLTLLQENSLALRARPAEILLRPLVAFAEAQSKQHGLNAKLTYSGGELQLDQIVMDQMRAILKSLIVHRIGVENPPQRFHVSLSHLEDRIVVDLEDNGLPSALSDQVLAHEAELTRRGGSLRAIAVPGGGVRHHIAVPLHVNVIDGMVVRVGAVRYVLPISAIQRIHQSRDQVRISASGGMRMLRVDEGNLVRVHELRGLSRHTEAADLYVIVKAAHTTMAIPVDELLGQQLVMLRPLCGVLSGMPNLSGMAILSGGEVGMVVATSRLGEALNAA